MTLRLSISSKHSNSSRKIQPVAKMARLFFCLAVGVCSLLWPSSAQAQPSHITLVDGMLLGPGQLNQISTIAPSGMGAVNSKVGVTSLPISVLDDGLRYTHVNMNRIVKNAPSNDPVIKIELGNKMQASSKGAPVPPGPAIETSPFDVFGRRSYFIQQPNGKIAIVVQGITEVTPNYVRIEGLRGEKGEFEWDMRLALSSFNSQKLKDILVQAAEQKKSQDWLDIVSLFLNSKRYLDAREMLVRTIHKFPELEANKTELTRIDQLIADQLFTASKSAQDAGQHEFARLILENMDKSGLSIETQLKIDRAVGELDNEKKARDECVQSIRTHIAAMPEGAVKKDMTEVADEIAKYLTRDTYARFADYLRRRDDKALKPEQLASIAISGWIFGPTVGEDNSSVVASGIRARKLITEYLSNPVRNDQLVEDISRLESGSPKFVSKILEFMPPPLATSSTAAVKTLVKPADSTQAPTETVIPGRYVIEVPMSGRMRDRTARYIVQLPPEYNPFRRYPCVLTLPSELSTAEGQLSWWVGPFEPNSPGSRCLGEATNRGYIVVAPDWAEPKQPVYNYTENEQALILSPLRDAMRRFSIDTDKVFVSGHFMGADAAWDLAWSHPDLWAGSIMIGGTADKYVIQYGPNAEYVPSYFVSGYIDGLADINGRVWDTMLNRKQIDCIVTLYRGRKLDNFQEELPRIMDWMSMPARVRKTYPEEFQTKTCRAGDRFFWWFETEQLNQQKLVNPLLFQPGSEYEINSSINKETNSVRFKTIPAKNYTVWLSPEFVDFSSKITIDDRGTKKRIDPAPNIRDMLQDVRGRSDRQHPFWMRVDM